MWRWGWGSGEREGERERGRERGREGEAERERERRGDSRCARHQHTHPGVLGYVIKKRGEQIAFWRGPRALRALDPRTPSASFSRLRAGLRGSRGYISHEPLEDLVVLWCNDAAQNVLVKHHKL